MKNSRINQPLCPASPTTPVRPQKQRVLLAFLVLFLLLLLLGILQRTLGKFSLSFIASDSALAAKFDLIVTAPEEFKSEQGENLFEYHFLSDTDVREFHFRVDNYGEADILCRPHITNGIEYSICVEGKELSEFAVRAKETAYFQLFIAPDGLDEKIKGAEFFIDLQQIEGGGRE